MIKIIVLIFLAQILDTAGQIFFKKGSVIFESSDIRSLSSYLKLAISVFKLPEIWAGFALMAVGMVSWLAALAGADISKAIPISSIQYLLVMLGSAFFLREKICREKIIGTLLITVGIILIAIS